MKTLKKLTFFGILMAAMVFALAGCNKAAKTFTAEAPNESEVMEEDHGDEGDVVEKEEEDSDKSADEDEEIAEAADPEYIAYSDELYESLLGSEPFALFFHATWCPTCRYMESDFQENLADFPAGTKILQTDYDTEDELKETYGITSQSLVVLVDSNGEASSTLVAPSAEQLKAALEKLL